MFGNFALRDELQKRGEKDSRFARMHHFVWHKDIVPSCTDFNYVYKNLSTPIKFGIYGGEQLFKLVKKGKFLEKIFQFDSKAVDEVDFAFKKYDTLHEPTHMQPAFDKKR